MPEQNKQSSDKNNYFMTPNGRKVQKIDGSPFAGAWVSIASIALGLLALYLMFFDGMSLFGEILCLSGFMIAVRGIEEYQGSCATQKIKPKLTLIGAIIGIVINAIALLFWAVWLIGYFVLN